MDAKGFDGWDALDSLKFENERETLARLLANQPLGASARAEIGREALAIVEAVRRGTSRQGVVESFLQEFSLATEEGLALMCLAEALLRTPDADTRDRLIAEKIGSADWIAHLGRSDSLFVNASTWALMLTGRLVDVGKEPRHDLTGWLARLAGRLGEPVIRKAVATAVAIMGEQFVVGRTIGEALARAGRERFLCSFDMLGEGARTAADAARYEAVYADAIEAVGRASGGAGPELGHGISVKLSALSPRYEAVQEARACSELYPRLLRLATLAARQDLNLAIDAEEADRLTLSLEFLERLAREPALAGWNGLGIVVQAYQKRASAVIYGIERLAASTWRRIMVRLVKGAYWDSEIKRAQVAGRPDYPVFTTKPATDLSYLCCAKALIEASPRLYPQFATHNAHTLAAVRQMACAAGVSVEHQRLHGMGEALYRAAQERYGPLRLRTYAPVGTHEELLPYLVRRLLENGANTSFVHALLDADVPAGHTVEDPVALVKAHPDRHPRIPPPPEIYGPSRRNSLGRDFSLRMDRERVAQAGRALDGAVLAAGPIVRGVLRDDGPAEPVRSPVDGALVGTVIPASARHIDEAVAAGREAQPGWNEAGGCTRAAVLRAMGDALEADMDGLVALLAREAGKVLEDGVAEVREAADFCRYYAALAETQFGNPIALPGPVGETNRLALHGRGVFACISPWGGVICGWPLRCKRVSGLMI